MESGSWRSSRWCTCQYCSAVRSFGPRASHRETTLGHNGSWKQPSYPPLPSTSCPFGFAKARVLMTRDEWVAVHGDALLTRFAGFLPYSFLLVKKLVSYVLARFLLVVGFCQPKISPGVFLDMRHICDVQSCLGQYTLMTARCL